MQLQDPDLNVETSHAFITWYIDPYGNSMKREYELQIRKELQNQLLMSKYGSSLRSCPVVSLNLEKGSGTVGSAAPTSSCDLKIDLQSILTSVDTSISPHLQQVEIQTKVEKQLGLDPQVQGWVKYECRLMQPSDTISLHLHRMRILSGVFVCQSRNFEVVQTFYDEKKSQIMKFRFGTLLLQMRTDGCVH